MKKCVFLLLTIILFLPQVFSQDDKQPQNNISWNLIDMGLQRFTMDYERMTKTGNMSFIIPISYRFGEFHRTVDDYNSYNYSPIGDLDDFKDESNWYVGFGFMFHPISKPTKVKFFFGPEIRFGGATHRYDYYYYEEYDYISSDFAPSEEVQEIKYAYAAFLVDVGIKYYPIKQLFMGVKIGVGAYGNHENSINAIISPAFKMGYSF